MYIHPDAHASYRHWWEAQTYWLWCYYRWDEYRSVADDVGTLYPHLRKKSKRRRRYSWSNRGRFIPKWNVATSGESSFRQAGYETKVVDESEQSRRDWRDRKGFTRDKSKGCRFCGCGRHVKDTDHRTRRAYERQMIKTGRWDEMYDHQDMFVSSWDCC